ncbi:MAG: hypothetical protein JWM27_484 [Gemmatimonadetes bacterium]|nr:hypothetical protein [Gemmatimonadota bacterium]
MDDAIHAAFAGWANFYLLTGTAAAALTGLQFVVQSLLASNAHRAIGQDDPAGGIEAFGTPTVVHFTVALVVSAVMSVPWPGYGSLRATLGAVGAGALVYSGVVLRRARRQRSYVPVAEDWIFHILLPAAAYAAVLLATLLLGRGAGGPDFVVAAATLLLLCVGIHNAWDTVTYLTVNALRRVEPGGEPAPPPQRGSEKRRRRRR